MDLKVTTETRNPRTDTETLIETVLTLSLPADAQVLDLGTGSGAIAMALAKERPNWRITATDISRVALDVAKSNAEQLQINNVEFFQGDWFAALPQFSSSSVVVDAKSLRGNTKQGVSNTFDLIVSNPPYLSSDDPHLNQGDLRFEPRSALVAGKQGLADYLKIVAQAGEYLKPAAWLVLEHGFAQADQVRQLLQRFGLVNISTKQDLAGRDRVSMGQRT